MEELNNKYDTHIVYKTTNLDNNKIYIGIHSQNGEGFDGYLGSGLIISQAINKNTKPNFIRETLFSYKTREESLIKESELVNQDFINRDDTYNITLGGKDNIITNCLSESAKSKRRNTINSKYGSINSFLNSDESRNKAQSTLSLKYGSDHMKRMHTDEAKLNAKSTKYKNALIRHPYIEEKCILLDFDKNEIIRGTLYDLAVYCYGSEYALTKHLTLYNKLLSGKKITQGTRKGFTVIKQ